ncbi:MAG: UDP-N-acetylmuramate--L-alanine ligase [Alphaproteobacteria bacterium]|nr:MAG: UDP-N-acetylmuramate--L-alanine ligase [Alphaproteobacteria bacterium]
MAKPLNLNNFSHFHFIGIGGIGMSGIAKILAEKGFQVSGSDFKSVTLKNITTYVGHDKNNIKHADIIVISTAIHPENPELLEAQQRNIPIFKRADILKEIIKKYKNIVSISGAHGKTTTTALIWSVLKQTNLDPTIINGGVVNAVNSNIYVGQTNDWCVVEADESDGSFLDLIGTYSVVTNIDREHLNHYSSLEHLKNSFIEFINKSSELSIICIDDPLVQSLRPLIKKDVITYGILNDAMVQAYNIRKMSNKTIFDVKIKAPLESKILKDIELAALGTHNVLNALSAIALAQHIKIDDHAIYEGLKHFQGVQRRFTIRHTTNNEITFVDDYAHNPKKISAVYETAKQSGAKRVIAVFEAHRYTRLKELMDEFVEALNAFNYIFIIPIYAANEQPIDGVSVEVLSKKLTAPHAYVATQEELNTHLPNVIEQGDIVVFMGAGNILSWSKNYLSHHHPE